MIVIRQSIYHTTCPLCPHQLTVSGNMITKVIGGIVSRGGGGILVQDTSLLACQLRAAVGCMLGALLVLSPCDWQWDWEAHGAGSTLFGSFKTPVPAIPKPTRLAMNHGSSPASNQTCIHTSAVASSAAPLKQTVLMSAMKCLSEP